MKKPSPRITKLILKASLKGSEHLKNFSNSEIVFLYKLGIGEIAGYGFSIEEAVSLLCLIRKELHSRA
jgi:hypothetical protein